MALYYLVYWCRSPIGACTFGTVSGYSGHNTKAHYFYSCCSGCSISCHQTSFRNWVQLIRLELSGRCSYLLHPCLQVGQAHWLWHFKDRIPGVLVLYLGWPSCGSFDHRQAESSHCFRSYLGIFHLLPTSPGLPFSCRTYEALNLAPLVPTLLSSSIHHNFACLAA